MTKALIVAKSKYTTKEDTKSVLINKIKKFVKQNPTSYEIIDRTKHEYVRPYFDIDVNDTEEGFNALFNSKEQFLSNIKECIIKHFKCEDNDFAISETERKDKISYHIILHNKKVLFSDFCTYMKQNKIEFNKFHIDNSVYKTYQKFRLIKCRKENQKELLKPLTHKKDLTKHLITAFDDHNELIKLKLKSEITTNKNTPKEIKKIAAKHYCDIDRLTYICNDLAVSRFDYYVNSWCDIALSICNISIDNNFDGKTLLLKLSQQSSRFDFIKFNEFLSNSYKYTEGYGLGCILNMLKEDNYESFLLNTLGYEKTYANIKEEFEKNNFKLMYPFMFCTEKYDDVIVSKNKDFTGAYHNKYYYAIEEKEDKKGNATRKLIKSPFIVRWVADETMRTYDKFDFYPDITSCPNVIYNLFDGLKINKEKIDVEYDESKIDLILNHIKKLTGNNKECFDYFVKWLAQIVQEPNKLSRTAIIFISDQGTGKNIFTDWVGSKILGKKYYFTSEKADDIFGTFAEGLKNKLLVNLNETSGKDTFELSESIKSKITDKTITYQKKYMSTIVINNYSRFIFTSNNLTPVKIDISDRRFVVMQCDNSQIKLKDKYFEPLIEQMDSLESQQIFYKYLMNVDIKGFNFEKERPITELYNDIKNVNTPKVILFIMDLIDNHKLDEQYSFKKLYEKYETFLSRNGYTDYKTNTNKFSRALKSISGIDKRKSKFVEVHICKKSLLTYLKLEFCYDPPEKITDKYSKYAFVNLDSDSDSDDKLEF
jgi:hypothetical protein